MDVRPPPPECGGTHGGPLCATSRQDHGAEDAEEAARKWNVIDNEVLAAALCPQVKCAASSRGVRACRNPGSASPLSPVDPLTPQAEKCGKEGEESGATQAAQATDLVDAITQVRKDRDRLVLLRSSF